MSEEPTLASASESKTTDENNENNRSRHMIEIHTVKHSQDDSDIEVEKIHKLDSNPKLLSINTKDRLLLSGISFSALKEHRRTSITGVVVSEDELVPQPHVVRKPKNIQERRESFTMVPSNSSASISSEPSHHSTTFSFNLSTKTASQDTLIPFHSKQTVDIVQYLDNNDRPLRPILKTSPQFRAYTGESERPGTPSSEAKLVGFSEHVQVRETTTYYQGKANKIFRCSFWMRSYVAHSLLITLFLVIGIVLIVAEILGFTITQSPCDKDYMRYILLSDIVNCFSFLLFIVVGVAAKCIKSRSKSKISPAANRNEEYVDHIQDLTETESFQIHRAHQMSLGAVVKPKLKHQDSLKLFKQTQVALEDHKPSKGKSQNNFAVFSFATIWVLLHVWGLVSLVSVIDYGTCASVNSLGLIVYITNACYFCFIVIFSAIELTIALITLIT